MTINIHFEKMAPGMKAKLDPKYRTSKNHLFDDYDAIKRELRNSSQVLGSTSFTTRKTTSAIPTGVSH